MKIGRQLTEKQTKNMRYWLVVAQGIVSYSKSHSKSVTLALHVFRPLPKQFPSDPHETRQAPPSSPTAPAPKISGENIMQAKR